MKEKYNVLLSKTTIKKEINKLFVDSVMQNKNIHNQLTLILDSELLYTSKLLLKNGVKKKDIVIPNPFVYKKIVKQRLGINVYNQLLFDYLDNNINIFKNVWLDYMCSLDGNEIVNPKEDIEKIFKNIMIANNSVFAITLANRKKTEYSYQHFFEGISYICSIANKNGYTAIPKEARVYRGMFFILFNCYLLS